MSALRHWSVTVQHGLPCTITAPASAGRHANIHNAQRMFGTKYAMVLRMTWATRATAA